MRLIHLLVATVLLCVVGGAAAKDIRIPANKNPTAELDPPKIRVNKGGADAVGSGGYMVGLPNDQLFGVCEDGSAKNAGTVKERLEGFPPNPDGCWYMCENAKAINYGVIDQEKEKAKCLFTCQDPSATNFNVGPFETEVTCTYPPPDNPPAPPGNPDPGCKYVWHADGNGGGSWVQECS